MNRWSEAFDNDPFHERWTEFMNTLGGIKLGAEISSNIVAEYSRLKKIVALIDSTIQSIDKDAFHLQTFTNAINLISDIQNYLNYFKDDLNNLEYIEYINNGIDQVLNLFRPYMIMPDAVAKAIKKTTESQKKILANINISIVETSQERLTSLNNSIKSAKRILSEIKATYDTSDELYKELFGSDEQDGLNQEIKELKEEIYNLRDSSLSIFKAIKEQETSVDESTILINNYKTDLETNNDEIKELLVETNSEIDALKSFYTKIFGMEDEEGSLVGGLKSELVTYKNGLMKYESSQKEKIEGLISEIENLLPGAISAGLASAYRSLKDECDKPIKNFTNLFYLALFILLAVGSAGFIFAIKSEGILESLVYNFLQISPIVVPAIWLAIFTSRRRNDFQRLRQEYAHKEAVTSSYQSFKQQIDKLGENQPEMLTSLLKTAIKTIDYNASHALDGTKQESSPLFESLENVIHRSKTKITDNEN